MEQLNFIDLFAGAGGLSEGFLRAGFQALAHVEADKMACETLRTRTAYNYLMKHDFGRALYEGYLKGSISKKQLHASVRAKLLESILQVEISWETMQYIFQRIDALAGAKDVHVIVGGPPCQAYSVIGRARDPQSMRNDRRNYLYQYYGEFLRRYQPQYFVFENVLGLLSAGNSSYFDEMRALFSYCGYSLDFQIFNAADYDVVQHRKRVFLVGRRMSGEFKFPWPRKKVNPFEISKDLFADLPALKSGQSQLSLPYYSEPTTYLLDHSMRNHFEIVSQHFTRSHRETDLEIYRIAATQMQQESTDIQYDTLPLHLRTHRNNTTFLDRFKVVNPLGKSHTLVAHISKDGHHFIHPDPAQNRSISVREAARIQSFPDDYFFEGGMTAAFKQIGNAVPPLLAEAIARAMRWQMEE